MIKTLTHQQGRFGGPGRPVIQKLLSVLISVSSSPGVIEHRGQPNSPVRYFTQEEINQGEIMYRPPAAPPHLQEFMAFSFAGNASDSAFRHRVSPSMAGSPSLPQNLHTEDTLLPVQNNLVPINLYRLGLRSVFLFLIMNSHSQAYFQPTFIDSGVSVSG